MMQITELEVWKAAINLAKNCYELSRKFPEKETMGLGYQLRCAATHLPANVSAAASRKHGKESLRHLFRSRDIIYEVESQIYLARALDFISEEELERMLEMLNTSKRLLFGFIKYYKRSSNTGNGKSRYNKPREENFNRSDDYYGNSDHDSAGFEETEEAGVEREF